MTRAEWSWIRLLKTLFPLLPRTTSSSLRAVIRRTILTDIKTANQRTKNHKLNRAVQAMLFGMIERGMSGTVLGDKGKLRGNLKSSTERASDSGGEAMWAVVLTKELWKKGVWFVPVGLHIGFHNKQMQGRRQICRYCCIGMLSPCHQSPERISALLPWR